MRIGLILRFISAAVKYSKTTQETAPQGTDAIRLRTAHRKIVLCGASGAVIGLIMGVVTMIAMWMHPPHGALRPDDIYISIFGFFVMIAAGIIGGASWAFTFAPRSVYLAHMGARWMKFLGTEDIRVARGVSIFVALLVTAIFIAAPICIQMGKV
jgi:hypothetical protein